MSSENTAQKIQASDQKENKNPADQQPIENTLIKIPKFDTYLGVFLLSAALLLFEVSLTRIFSVILWGNIAFMVVSTALFGFGLSGVFLGLRKKENISATPALFCLASGIAIVFAYFVITHVPFQMWQFHRHPLNYLYLLCWELAIMLPFFLGGMSLVTIFSKYLESSGKLYGVDLIGAAVGSFLMLGLINFFGGEGLIIIAGVLALVASMLFSNPSQIKMNRVSLALIILLSGTSFFTSDLMPLKFYQSKRRFNEILKKGWLLDTKWSALSRVDIAKHKPNTGPLKGQRMLGVWIDGGTNASIILPWDGNLETLKPQTNESIGAVDFLKNDSAPNSLIIGPSGGKEVLFALSHGAKHIDAVEMDPSIVSFANSPRFADYMGHLYQNPKVNFVNDEGRAFMKRQPENNYDIIQFVNNYTPVAIASGAINLTETFLITKEAFKEYYRHLTPNGVLALHRGATLRVALTAIEALRELGISNPEQHLLITNGEYMAFQGFYLKKQPWTEEEADKLLSYLTPLLHYGRELVLWNPLHPKDNLYKKVLESSPEKQKHYYNSFNVNLSPATDDQPFIEHLAKFGKVELSSELPQEFHQRNDEKWRGIIPRGDLPYIAIFAVSALLALLFVATPLVLFARGAIKLPGFFNYMIFYAALGFNFIVVEICLMKRYILFLGHPAYSITTILVALLLGAGIGSILSNSFDKTKIRKNIMLSTLAILFFILFESNVTPMLFEKFLAYSFLPRMSLAILFILPLGILMGMPFNLGLKLIENSIKDEYNRRQLVAWAWGINGYATVMGSSATVFIALFFGFKVALMAAALGYQIGMILLLVNKKLH